MTESIPPVLKTSIYKSESSTSTKLRFYVRRELDVDPLSDISRLSLYHKFQAICKHELTYQELTSDLSISCFCRTGVVDTSVILETDCECETLRDQLQDMTLDFNDVTSIAIYLQTLHRKTCVQRSSPSLIKFVLENFKCDDHKQTIIRTVFEDPIHKLQATICPLITQFGEKQLLRNIDVLTQRFLNMSATVTHGNFVVENIVLRDTQRCGKVVSYGAELSHVGNFMYDVGSFVGDLLIWHYIHKLKADQTCKRRQFCHTLEQCIVEFLTIYFEDFDLLVNDSSVIPRMFSWAVGFAAISMLFRVVGKDWNDKLPISDSKVRDDIVGCAFRLLSGYERITCANQLLIVGLMLP